jgi:hypothetical protein
MIIAVPISDKVQLKLASKAMPTHMKNKAHPIESTERAKLLFGANLFLMTPLLQKQQLVVEEPLEKTFGTHDT